MPRTENTASPAKQVAGFIAKFDPAIAKLTRATRSRVRKRLPTAVELVYDNYNALAIGFGPTEKTTDAILSVAAYARGVTLFIYGALLPDPNGLLEGGGNQGRFIRITDARQIDDPKVAALIAGETRPCSVRKDRQGLHGGEVDFCQAAAATGLGCHPRIPATLRTTPPSSQIFLCRPAPPSPRRTTTRASPPHPPRRSLFS